MADKRQRKTDEPKPSGSIKNKDDDKDKKKDESSRTRYSQNRSGSPIDESLLSLDDSSIEMHYNSDMGIYKFFKTHGKDAKKPNIPKTEAFIYMTIPPDGGYAWIILFVSFICQGIIDGILLSIGILLPHIAEELSMSFKQTAFIASTQIGIYFLTAPLASAFINKFGFRRVATIGALVASMAYCVASFSHGMFLLVFFHGIIAGIGMGMVWMSSTLIVNYYFERYRAIAGGLASSGSGMGLVLVSMLNVIVVEKVGWRNTVRINALLIFLSGLLALTFKEVKPTKIGHFVELLSDDDTDESLNSVEIASDRYSRYIMPTPSLVRSVASMVSGARNMNSGRRVGNYGDVQCRISYLIEVIKAPKLSFSEHICCCCSRKRSSLNSDTNRFVIAHDPLDRDDIFYDGAPVYDQINELTETNESEVMPEKDSKARTINYTLSMIRPVPQQKSSFPQKFKSAFNTLFDLRLLNMALFRFLLLEAFLFPMGYNIPFVYSSCRAQIRKDLANLLPVVIGSTNVLFKISVGFIAYKSNCHTAYLAGSGMLLGSSVTLLSAFVGTDSEWFQFFFAACFAIGTGSFGALRATVYVKVLGLERLTNAFGLSTMVMGIGVFIGTNVGGILNDNFEGYSVAFAFSGLCMTIASCLKLCVPKYAKYRRIVDAKKAQKKVRFAKPKPRSRCWRLCC